jgi:CRISPR-associated protein Cmr6
MVFDKAFKKAIVQKGEDIGITIPEQNHGDDWESHNPQQVPMMYRAQVQGRCSLQYGKNNTDLNRWTEEWVYPDSDETPSYQYAEPQLGWDGSVYRIKIEFPFRVFSNCGQDSILRPVIGTNGIPFIPGSSIKGLFERLSRHPQVTKELKQKVQEYCGNLEKPGILRFHGAYPVGDWAGKKTVKLKNGREETRYRMVDVVHPQQEPQVQGTASPKAIATISFYHPIFVFELSSRNSSTDDDWKTITGLLKRALRQGLGGKTSTGYGLCFIPQDKYSLSVNLKGVGVSPLLRSDEPEFRPNLFKASLKGHVSRLLAGISEIKEVENKTKRLFGHTTEPGVLQLYWENQLSFPKYDIQGQENTPIYQNQGTLYLDAPTKQDISFLQKVLEFTFVMGGLGKSWRRVWHKEFLPSYQTRAIGCHWEWIYSNFDRTVINNKDDLQKFLTQLRQETMSYMGVKSTKSSSWKEAWCPQRLSVYSKVVSQSNAISLFHDDKFKTTPAIGGRTLDDDRPTSFSFVWHRMLPIDSNKYLEIVTLFHGVNSGSYWLDKWMRRNDDDDKKWENQLPLFVQELQRANFEFTWGSEIRES